LIGTVACHAGRNSSQLISPSLCCHACGCRHRTSSSQYSHRHTTVRGGVALASRMAAQGFFIYSLHTNMRISTSHLILQFHTCTIANYFAIQHVYNSKNTWSKRETLQATAGWRGGKQKQVGVLEGSCSSPGR
jgi:hypothetical protein